MMLIKKRLFPGSDALFHWLLLAISAFLPLAAGGIALSKGFDGLYGQDAYAYYDYAVVSLAERLYPPAPFFWPPGYSLSVLGMSLIVGKTPLAGQLVSLLCGGLTVMAAMLLAYEVSDQQRRLTALMTGLAIVVMGQLWQSSMVVMADTLSLATATLGVWALCRYARLIRERETLPGAGWLMLAAVLVAYATITRWIYGMVAVVCFIYALALLWRLYKRNAARAARHTAWAAAAALMILLPVIIPILTQPETTFGGNFQLQGNTFNPVNMFKRQFFGEDGYLNYTLPNGLYYAVLPAREFYFTPMLALFALPGIAFMMRSRLVWRYFLLWGWVLGVYLFLVSLPQQNVRFTLSYTPPVAVFIGLGVVYVYGRVRRYHLLRYAIVGSIIAGLAWAIISGTEWSQDFIDRKQHDLAVVRWAQSHIPPEAQLITFGVTLTMRHYTPIETHEIYYLTPPETRTLAAEVQSTYLLLNVYNIQSQWAGKSPSENYFVLRDEIGLRQIARSGNYTLFKVSQP